MNKLILICDHTWHKRYTSLNRVKYNKVKILNFKSDSLIKSIVNISKEYPQDYLLIVNDNFFGHFKLLNNIIINLKRDNIIVYGNKLDNFDFTKIGNDCVIGFDTNKLLNNLGSINYNSTINHLQRYIISNSIDYKYNVKIMNYKNKIKDALVDEDQIFKTTAKRKRRNVRRNESVDERFIKKRNKKSYFPELRNKIPKVLFVCDVKGWAWWIKSQYIKKYLKPYYDIDVISIIDSPQKINYNKYDLYFTFGYSYISRITNAEEERRISGLTAHRPLDILQRKIKNVSWAHANSVLLYNELKKIHNSCFYTPNGVDTDLFKQKELLKNGKVKFGHIGKKSPKKGQSEYIEPAIEKTESRYFSHYNNYKSKVSHEKMPNLYQNFDVFLCASEEDGTPCPALEAAACGRPIISNKIGSMPELIENYKTGILLEKRDIDLYVDAIKWCKDNPEKVVEMGNNIRRKVETEWTWELMSKNYLYMFDYILQIDRGLSYYENPALHHIEGE